MRVFGAGRSVLIKYFSSLSILPYCIQVEGVAHAQENRPLLTHVFSSLNLPVRCKSGLGRLPFISMLSIDLGLI
jgi:hypothetical protein